MYPPSHPMCRCSTVEYTMGEFMADCAESLLVPKGAVIQVDGSDGTSLAKTVTAFKLYKNKRLLLRAMVEGWDLARIVEEIYS